MLFRSLEKRAEDDGLLLGNQFEFALDQGRVTFGFALACRGEGKDGSDLALRVAAKDVLVGGPSVRPERRHQRAGPVARRIQQVLAQPARLEALAEQQAVLKRILLDGRTPAP